MIFYFYFCFAEIKLSLNENPNLYKPLGCVEGEGSGEDDEGVGREEEPLLLVRLRPEDQQPQIHAELDKR